MFRFMKLESQIQTYFTFRSNGMQIIEWAAQTQQTQDSLLALGMPGDYATNVLNLVELFFHADTHSRYQSRSRRKAKHNKHSIETLTVIWQSSKNIKDATKRWQFREELCDTEGDTLTIQRMARRIKKRYVPKQPPKDGMRVRRVGDKITVSFTGPSTSMQDMVTTLKHASDEDGRPVNPVEWILGNRPIISGEVTTHAVMTIDDVEHVLRGDSTADDVLVQLTDGTILTGTELAQRAVRERGFITLLSPAAGPINVYDAIYDIAEMQKRHAPHNVGHAA